MKKYANENLSYDPVHGYIPFTSPQGLPEGELSERDIIDSPWVQRMRQIHQLQTAWWVFPSAEHTRFQHVMGVMHLASRAVAELYDSLAEVCPDLPSRGHVETLMRLAGLLHDVGHGPFGHFFDSHFLKRYGLTHETLGAEIIRRELADSLRRVRRNPNSVLRDDEQIDPEHITLLITRPTADENNGTEPPRWLSMLRGLFCGLYTVDNMDFVLRDAFMSGFNARSFDLDRLLHYTYFSERGLTIHERGLSALVRFISVRGDLFRSIYFHRTVRAIDLALSDLFTECRDLIFPSNPLDHLDDYQRFTEWSLLVDTSNWDRSDDPKKRELAPKWQRLMNRQLDWTMVAEQTLVFRPGESETSSIFSDNNLFESALRNNLPEAIRDITLRVDTARHVHRPGAHMPTAGYNFLLDSASEKVKTLDDRQLYRHLPLSYRICRVYAKDTQHRAEIAKAFERLAGSSVEDDATNM